MKSDLLIYEDSQQWKLIEAYLQNRLKAARKRNDNSLTVEETAKLRGAIAEIKYLLQMPQKANSSAARSDTNFEY